MCMAAVLAMTGCGGSESASATAAEQAAEPEIILKYSEVNPDGHFLTDTAYYFADQVAEKSNGRIKIDIYPAGQLANEKDGIQTIQTSSGVIDIVRCSTSSLSDFGVQKLNVLSMPYIIRDREHYWNVAQSDVGEELKAEPQELGLGMVGLFYVDEGFRHFFTVDPVNSIEDLDGNNKAVYLDIPEEDAFDTMPHVYNENLSAPVILTSIHYRSGATDAVRGRHDGSPGSNTNGKYPYRVQGREYAVGGYIVASDTVIDLQSDFTKHILVAPKGVAHSSSDATIRSTYEHISTIPAAEAGNNADWWIGDCGFDVDTGSWYPSAEGICGRLKRNIWNA